MRALPADWGVTLHQAADGLEGVEQILMGHRDLIFLDLTMPEMDGYGCSGDPQARRVRSKQIVVSGDIQPEAHERVMALGALDFIKKPASPDTLLALLKRHGLWQSATQVTAIQPQPVASHQAAQSSIQFTPSCGMSHQELANVAMGQGADLLARLLGASCCSPSPTSTCWRSPSCTWRSSAAAESETLSAVCQGFIGAGIAGRPCCCSTMPASRTWPA